MAQVTGNKQYVVVDLVNKIVAGSSNFGFGYDDETETEPDPQFDMEDHELVFVSDETLGGLSLEEFTASKMPVIVDGAFSSWSARAAAPVMALLNDVEPTDDGSVVPTVGITGGPASSDFQVVLAAPHVKTDLTDNLGTFDENGAGSFRIKASGGGGSSVLFRLQPYGHQDFIEVSLEVAIVKTSF